ncbi:MAG: hypothetical protein AB1564_00065 [Chloroflexota bacterium]
MKLKRHIYNNHAERAIHFFAGSFYFLLINTVLTCGLVISYNHGYMETRQAPFPIEATLWVLGVINILVFYYFCQTAHWVAFGMIGAIIANELIWLGLGARDLMTIIMPFWMAIGYFD